MVYQKLLGWVLLTWMKCNMALFNPMDGYKTCRFPKHKGKLWTDILEEDKDYVIWIYFSADSNLSDQEYEYLEELLEEV